MEKSQEISRRALDLVLAIYRVTDKLPRGEILVWQLRRLGNEILEEIILEDFSEAKKKINVLLNYFQIAQKQNWVREINWSVLAREYKLLTRQIAKTEERGNEAFLSISRNAIPTECQIPERADKDQGISQSPIQKTEENIKARNFKNNISVRQQKILQIIKAKGSARMSDLVIKLKTIASERTLRSDLSDLVSQGIIKKNGANKSSTYIFK